MKKLTLAIIAVVIGLAMTSCGGGSEKAKESMIKDADEYFTKAEQTLAQIDNTEDFLMFAESMKDRSDLLESMKEKYDNKITDEDLDAAFDVIYDRATAYNNAEAAKCAEFLTPALDKFEAVVNELYAQYQAGEALSKDKVLEFNNAFGEVMAFVDYDNVPQELSDRYDAIIDAKVTEMDGAIQPILDELFPEE